MADEQDYNTAGYTGEGEIQYADTGLYAQPLPVSHNVYAVQAPPGYPAGIMPPTEWHQEVIMSPAPNNQRPKQDSSKITVSSRIMGVMTVGFLLIFALCLYCTVVISQINLRTLRPGQTSNVVIRRTTLENSLVRLVGGSSNSGRVEVYYRGEWGTVCDDSWGINDAKVVCRMLGFSGAISSPGSARFGEGTGRIWLDEVNCRGTEASLWDCSKSPWGNENCGHNEDASVVCRR